MQCPDCDHSAKVIDPQDCQRCQNFGRLCNVCGQATANFGLNICLSCTERAFGKNPTQPIP